MLFTKELSIKEEVTRLIKRIQDEVQANDISIKSEQKKIDAAFSTYSNIQKEGSRKQQIAQDTINKLEASRTALTTALEQLEV